MARRVVVVEVGKRLRDKDPPGVEAGANHIVLPRRAEGCLNLLVVVRSCSPRVVHL